MAVWYCMSIIGFDVHSCNTTGNIFVNSVLSGITCDDIHPEHDCSGHSSCCHSHKCCDHQTEDDCCTNEIEVLDSESIMASEDDASALFITDVAVSFLVNDYELHNASVLAQLFYYPDPGNVKMPDQQAVLNVWRI